MTIHLMDATADEDSVVVVSEYVSELLNDGEVRVLFPLPVTGIWFVVVLGYGVFFLFLGSGRVCVPTLSSHRCWRSIPHS